MTGNWWLPIIFITRHFCNCKHRHKFQREGPKYVQPQGLTETHFEAVQRRGTKGGVAGGQRGGRAEADEVLRRPRPAAGGRQRPPQLGGRRRDERGVGGLRGLRPDLRVGAAGPPPRVVV